MLLDLPTDPDDVLPIRPLLATLYWPDHEHRCLWCFIPKVASMSLRSAVCPGQCVRLDQAAYYNDYYTIAFVRPPYGRVVSAMFTVLRDLGPFEERMTKWITAHNRIDWMDMHVRPQTALLEGLDVNFYGHLGTIDDDWRTLQSRYRHLPDLPHRGKGQFRPDRWEDAGDILPYSWKSVEHLYAGDVKLCLESR